MFGFMCNVGWFKQKKDLKPQTPVFVTWGWSGLGTFPAYIIQKAEGEDSYIVRVEGRSIFWKVHREDIVIREDVAND